MSGRLDRWKATCKQRQFSLQISFERIAFGFVAFSLHTRRDAMSQKPTRQRLSSTEHTRRACFVSRIARNDWCNTFFSLSRAGMVAAAVLSVANEATIPISVSVRSCNEYETSIISTTQKPQRFSKRQSIQITCGFEPTFIEQRFDNPLVLR